MYHIFTVNPFKLSKNNPAIVKNFINGRWIGGKRHKFIIDPLNGDKFIKYPLGDYSEACINSMKQVPVYGLHNPLHKTNRYLKYGEISAKTANSLNEPHINEFFVKLIQRVMPKSYNQAKAEVDVTKKFLYNFSGDQVRFLAKGFSTPGDYETQQSIGYRFPYARTGLITPFNFPLEIPVLQLMGGLFMGNKVLLKSCERTSIVMEQFLRLLHYNGLPLEDVDFIQDRKSMDKIVRSNILKMIQFTGSSRVAEKLSKITNGKVKIEDAGFDFKIIDKDIRNYERIADICDKDAYECSGQKCSAQSLLLINRKANFKRLINLIKANAQQRNLNNLSIGPVLSWNNHELIDHINKLVSLKNSRLLFGGKVLNFTKVPKEYGIIEPTAILVDFNDINENNINLITKEVFGPVQIIMLYDNINSVIDFVNSLDHHLTAAIVSNNPKFVNYVSGRTINGTTYTGLRARTTGAPQNHFFGPGGDPRGAGIGTKEAIQNVWSYHREIISDY